MSTIEQPFATSEQIGLVSSSCQVDASIRILSNQFLTTEEKLKEISKYCPLEKGGPIVASNSSGGVRTLSEDEHSIVFASTGRGKTRRYVMPLLMTDILTQTNIVVNDCKGELLESMRGILAAMGYTTYVLDFRRPAMSPNHYNPLAIAWDFYNSSDPDGAFLYVRSFAEAVFSSLEGPKADPFWAFSAIDYFTALALGLLEYGVEESQFTLESVARMDRAGMTSSGTAKHLEHFFSCVPDGVASQFAAGVLSAPKDTRGSILSVFRSPLSVFVGMDGINSLLYRSDFSIPDLVKERIALFIISPDERHSLSPVMAGIFNQLMTGLVSYAQGCSGGVLERRVDFILDEFGNISARIPELSALVSACRSRNMRLHFALQSEQQFTNVYDEETKELILDNVVNWFYMGSRSLPFLKRISETAGNYMSRSGRSVPVMPVEKLQRLEKREHETESLVMVGSLKPFVASLQDIETYFNGASFDDYVRDDIEPNISYRAGKREVFDVCKVTEKLLNEKIKAAIEESRARKD